MGDTSYCQCIASFAKKTRKYSLDLLNTKQRKLKLIIFASSFLFGSFFLMFYSSSKNKFGTILRRLGE